jgi:hypothetical protein
MPVAPTPDREESFARKHRRQTYDMFPELRGLPYEVQQRLHAEAWEASREFKGGCLPQLRRFIVNLVFGVVVAGVIFWLAWSFVGSRFNPRLPFVCVFGPLAVLTMAMVAGMEGQRRHGRMRRYLWRRLLWICPDCGYDMTGNESGVCPECGRRRDPG